MPAGASAFYARNISNLLLGMVKDGNLDLDFDDEVTQSTVISHGGAITSEPVKKLLEPAPAAGAGGAGRRRGFPAAVEDEEGHHGDDHQGRDGGIEQGPALASPLLFNGHLDQGRHRFDRRLESGGRRRDRCRGGRR